MYFVKAYNYIKNNKLKCLVYFIIISLIYHIYLRIISPLLFYYYYNLKINSLKSYLFIYHEIFNIKEYSWLDNNSYNNDLVYFDIGGNIGLYSLYLNNNHNNIKVHVFEPIPDLYNKIIHNVNNNKKKSNTFFINNFGLGPKNEFIDINYIKGADGLSTIKNDINDKNDKIIKSRCDIVNNIPIVNNICKYLMSNIVIDDMNNSIKHKIEIRKLSDYIEKYNITKIDNMKIDVEGYELEVLQGLTYDNFKIIKKIMIEVENYRSNYRNQIIEILNKNNFDYIIDGDINDSWIMINATNKNIIKLLN